MTNKEKYGDKLIELSVNRGSYVLKNGIPALCWNTECRECDFYDKSSRTCKENVHAFQEWLNSEYVEPPVDWSKVAVDTPVLVRNSEMDAWKRRYFAGYNDNEVYVFSNGKTSYTYTDDEKPVIYRHTKLAEIPFNKDLFYQLYEQLLTLPADCQGKENNCNEDCSYCKDGNCMYYRLKGFVEDNPDVLGDIEPELSTDFMMS